MRRDVALLSTLGLVEAVGGYGAPSGAPGAGNLHLKARAEPDVLERCGQAGDEGVKPKCQ